MFSRDCFVCAWMFASASSPVAGLIGSWPEMYILSPATIAWEYGPIAPGAFVVATTFFMVISSFSLSFFLGNSTRKYRNQNVPSVFFIVAQEAANFQEFFPVLSTDGWLENYSPISPFPCGISKTASLILLNVTGVPANLCF